MLRSALVLAILLAGCGDGVGAYGGAPADGHATADAGDAGDAADASACAGVVLLRDLGHCFAARRCCVAADCGADRAWECTSEGLCQDPGRTCGCADDVGCAGGEFCFTNPVVCGVCMPTTAPCVRDASCGGGRCESGYCVDETMCVDYPSP